MNTHEQYYNCNKQCIIVSVSLSDIQPNMLTSKLLQLFHKSNTGT